MPVSDGGCTESFDCGDAGRTLTGGTTVAAGPDEPGAGVEVAGAGVVGVDELLPAAGGELNVTGVGTSVGI
jgi:hypothetical protein